MNIILLTGHENKTALACFTTDISVCVCICASIVCPFVHYRRLAEVI